MEQEPIPEEELEKEKLPEAIAYHAFGKQEAVDCPYCKGMEHATDVDQPGSYKKECEYEIRQGAEHPKEYIVKKAA